MKKFFINTISAIALLATIYGCGKDSFDKPDYYSRKAETVFGQQVVDGSADYIAHVKTSTERNLMDGVQLLELGILDRASHAVQAYIYKVELGAALVKISTPDNAAKVEKTQKLTRQATAIENTGKYLVMGGICGGAFNSETGMPDGILYHNSKVIGASFGKNENAFFAIKKDGAAVCLPSDDFESHKTKSVEAISGSAMILQEGYVLTETDAKTIAKAAVGVDAEGSTVYLIVVDGGDYFYSNGISNSDMANLMKGCGASNAMILNKGNNVSAFVRDEDSIELFKVIDKPSNMGLEAAIGNGLVILQL